MAGCDLLSVLAGEGSVVDGELHLHGSGINFHERQGFGVLLRGKGVADIDVVETCEANDVASHGFGHVVGVTRAGEAFHFRDLNAVFRAVFTEGKNRLADFNLSGQYATDGHAANIVVPVDIGGEHAEVAFFNCGSGDPFDDGLEQVEHILAGAVYSAVSKAHFGGSVEERGVELIFVCVEV